MDFLRNYFSNKDDEQRKSDVEVGAEATEGSVFVSESTPMEESSSNNDNKDMQEEVKWLSFVHFCTNLPFSLCF